MRGSGRSKVIALVGGVTTLAALVVAPTVNATSVVATIALPTGQGVPWSVATNSNTVWVGQNSTPPYVYRVDTGSNSVAATVTLPGSGSVWVGIGPTAGGKVYASSQDSGIVSRIDPAANTIDDSYVIGGGIKAFDLAVKQTAGVDDTVYVGSGAGVLVLDADTMTRDDTIPLAGASSGNYMYVATVGDDSIMATRFADDQVSIINPRTDDSISVPVIDPMGIAISPNNEWAYIASNSWYLYKVRTANGQVDDSLPLPGPAKDLAVASDGTIYLTVQNSPGQVRIYDQGSLAQAIVVSVVNPYGVAVSPSTGQAYVGSTDGPSLQVIGSFAPTPPSPSANPPGAPTDVVATGGWRKVTVNWKAPADVGSYPITNYMARATPGGKICITHQTGSTLTECTFTDLTPGTNYTFQVQALNGGGWSAQSAPSNSASPSDLRITSQSRKKVTFFGFRVGSEARVSGTSISLPGRTRLGVWLREGSAGQWIQQPGVVTTDSSGRFTWTRKFSAAKDSTPIGVKFSVGNDFSNEVVLPAVR